MIEMIDPLEESVARAICRVNVTEDNTYWRNVTPDEFVDNDWDGYLEDARAAIEIIRKRCALIARAHQERCEKLRDRQNALGRPAIEAQEQSYAAEEIAEAIEALK